MATVKPKAVVTMRLAAAIPTHSRTDVTVRDLAMTIDEPQERGGTNLGLSPTETLMAALLGCTNTIAHKVAEKNGVAIASMNLRLEALFDRRGVTLEEEIEIPFTKIKLYIDMTTEASEERVAAVQRELKMFCPVSKVIRASGTELEEIWAVTRP